MKGHCYGLIGENGCGKSSLLRAIRDTMEYELEGKGGFTFSLVSQDSVEELDKEDQTPWELLVTFHLKSFSPKLSLSDHFFSLPG